MPQTIRLPNNWSPRPYQLKSWRAWERGIKREILIWHRRAGKDDVAMHKIACAAHPWPEPGPNQRIANFWHCLPMYEQARKAIWEAVNPHSGKRRIDEAFPPMLRARTDNSSMVIEFKSGASYRIVGSDNPDSLVGAPPYGIVFSEWALSNPSAWGYLAPILAENDGWASFITTPRGRNHAKAMYDMARLDKAWFAEVLTPNETGFSLELIEQQRKEYHAIFGEEAGDALIEQEYWCSFEAAILGAYYGKEMVTAEREGRITDVPAWQGCPVHTAWDLGASRGGDTMTIWLWQIVPGARGKGQLRILEFLTGSSFSIAHWAGVLRQKRQAIADELKMTWEQVAGTDYVPHDARVPEMTSSGHDGKAKLRIEVMIENGLKPKIVINHTVSDGISAVRQALPRCWFDKAKTETVGVESLRQYQREWDDDKKTFRPSALNNWAAHGADAFRYLAVAYREVLPAPKPEDARVLQITGDERPANQVTLDDLWQLRPKRNRRI